MPITYAQLKARLDVDEPNYRALAIAAAGAMSHLRRLAASDDVGLASKAVSLAGIIGGADCIGVVSDAARSRNAVVRVAAAHAAASLPDSPGAARVVNSLLADKDIGVMKVAARAAAGQGDRAVAAKLKQANARLGVATRAAAKESKAKGRTNVARKKSAKVAPKKLARGSAADSAMPTGAMVNPPRGAKPGKMPTGTMR